MSQVVPGRWRGQRRLGSESSWGLRVSTIRVVSLRACMQSAPMHGCERTDRLVGRDERGHGCGCGCMSEEEWTRTDRANEAATRIRFRDVPRIIPRKRLWRFESQLWRLKRQYWRSLSGQSAGGLGAIDALSRGRAWPGIDVRNAVVQV